MSTLVLKISFISSVPVSMPYVLSYFTCFLPFISRALSVLCHACSYAPIVSCFTLMRIWWALALHLPSTFHTQCTNLTISAFVFLCFTCFFLFIFFCYFLCELTTFELNMVCRQYFEVTPSSNQPYELFELFQEKILC